MRSGTATRNQRAELSNNKASIDESEGSPRLKSTRSPCSGESCQVFLQNWMESIAKCTRQHTLVNALKGSLGSPGPLGSSRSSWLRNREPASDTRKPKSATPSASSRCLGHELHEAEQRGNCIVGHDTCPSWYYRLQRTQQPAMSCVRVPETCIGCSPLLLQLQLERSDEHTPVLCT